MLVMLKDSKLKRRFNYEKSTQKKTLKHLNETNRDGLFVRVVIIQRLKTFQKSATSVPEVDLARDAILTDGLDSERNAASVMDAISVQEAFSRSITILAITTISAKGVVSAYLLHSEMETNSVKEVNLPRGTNLDRRTYLVHGASLAEKKNSLVKILLAWELASRRNASSES